jgi:hypothetical protein
MRRYSEKKHLIYWILPAFGLFLCGFPLAATDYRPNPQAIQTEKVFILNGIRLVFDNQTGGLLQMSAAGGTIFLETVPEWASLVDMAYPHQMYEPRRLAPKFSKNVLIESSEEKITVRWEDIGASRILPQQGKVSATVQFTAADDGRSLIMTCQIENNSDQYIRQVLFPDLAGLVSFAGNRQTRLRTAAFVIEPFELLKADVDMVPFYATGKFHVGNGWIEYKSGRYKSFSQKLVDWYDFGNVNDGFSLFARRWPPEKPDISLMLHLSETDNKLRALFCHQIEIAPRDKWQSDEYWITPHQHGWAEGIEPFRLWASKNLKRAYEIPQHIKEGIGFRTLWMAKGLPAEQEQDVLYHFKDLPRIARESIEHGLNEMAIWFWSNYFDLPVQIIDSLGTKQELIEAIAECRQMGVNVSLFMSVLYLRNPSAARYGLTPTRETSWTYHPDLIPYFNPPYVSWYAAAMADQSNLKWQADVLSSFKTYIDMGLTSFVWDVFMAAPTKPNLYDLAKKIREAADQRDRQAVFAGEGGCDIPEDYCYLDYTWNWNWNWPEYKDFRAFTAVFSVPRLNVNIDESVAVLKYCFADNAYMNLMPASPDGINAADLLVNHPALSQALQQCAHLRQQFLPYFTNGKLIGECILTEESAGAHVSAYVLDNKILTVIVKDENEGSVSLVCDPGYWLRQNEEPIHIDVYNSEGSLTDKQTFTGNIWHTTINDLAAHEIVLYEFSGEKKN